MSYEITLTKETTPTRKLIVELLRKNGPSEYGFLAYELALSMVTTKKHCYRLNFEKIVDIEEKPGHKSIVRLLEGVGHG